MRLPVVPALVLLGGIAIGYQLNPGDPNAKPTYGSTGLPKNCRALIQANLDGLRSKQYAPYEAFASIERNCGAQGHNWGN